MELAPDEPLRSDVIEVAVPVDLRPGFHRLQVGRPPGEGVLVRRGAAMTVLDSALSERVFTDNLGHLATELAWLDLALRRSVLALRSATPAEVLAPGLHISDQEVEFLLAAGPTQPGADATALDAEVDALRAGIDARVARARGDGVELRLPALAERLGLSAFERCALLLCLAPELDRKYDRLFAYLQDDITRKRPSVDLVLTVLVATPTDRWRALHRFSAHAPLRRSGLLDVVVDAYSPSGSSALAACWGWRRASPPTCSATTSSTTASSAWPGSSGRRSTPTRPSSRACSNGTARPRWSCTCTGPTPRRRPGSRTPWPPRTAARRSSSTSPRWPPPRRRSTRH